MNWKLKLLVLLECKLLAPFSPLLRHAIVDLYCLRKKRQVLQAGICNGHVLT